jgi:hypothetical protein
MIPMRRALLLLCFALALTACGKQRLVTQPDQPPLAPPPPPPRVVTPPDTNEQAPEPVPEPDHKPARRAPARNESTREPAPKPEPPKPPAPASATPPAREEAPPPTTLQTTPPATQAVMERQARGLLTQAKKDLSRVNAASLNADGKGQYDTARRFVEQAQQALKEQNFVLALQLADKAATIAGVLVGR